MKGSYRAKHERERKSMADMSHRDFLVQSGYRGGSGDQDGASVMPACTAGGSGNPRASALSPCSNEEKGICLARFWIHDFRVAALLFAGLEPGASRRLSSRRALALAGAWANQCTFHNCRRQAHAYTDAHASSSPRDDRISPHPRDRQHSPYEPEPGGMERRDPRASNGGARRSAPPFPRRGTSASLAVGAHAGTRPARHVQRAPPAWHRACCHPPATLVLSTVAFALLACHTIWSTQ